MINEIPNLHCARTSYLLLYIKKHWYFQRNCNMAYIIMYKYSMLTQRKKNVISCAANSIIVQLVGLPGFAQDNCSIFVPTRVHFILFYFSHHGNSQSFDNLTSIKPQNAPWCPDSKTPEIPPIHPGSVEEWVGALVGPVFEYCCGNFASELWQFRLPCFASVFRRRH